MNVMSSLSLASRSFRPSLDTLHYLRTLNARPPTTTFTLVRHASHQAQGRANGPKNSPGKRLGAKKTGGKHPILPVTNTVSPHGHLIRSISITNSLTEEYVIPGNIIFRQRGTKWHAGENCSVARDHSIYATQPGFVKYYRDPARHPKKRYIGVVFERNMTLPTPPNAARRRRLGMYAVRRSDLPGEDFAASPVDEADDGGLVFPLKKNAREVEGNFDADVRGKKPAIRDRSKRNRERVAPKMRPDYSFRQGNWEIGRIPEVEGYAQKVRKFDRKDRFLAWRRREARKARIAEKRSMGAKSGKGKKKKGKK